MPIPVVEPAVRGFVACSGSNRPVPNFSFSLPLLYISHSPIISRLPDAMFEGVGLWMKIVVPC